jgi:hypothetical protein
LIGFCDEGNKEMVLNDHHHAHNDGDDDEDELQSRIWTFSVMAVSVPLFYMGKWAIGLCFLLIGFLYMGLGSLMRKLPAEDQAQIQYNIWSAEDVVEDLKRRLVDLSGGATTIDDGAKADSTQRSKAIMLSALTALTKKYKERQKQQEIALSDGKAGASSTDSSATVDNLALCFQEASYMSLRNSIGDEHDAVVSEALALLALVTKNSAVRERYVQQADQYGLDLLVQCMNQGLQRAKSYEDPQRELMGAELQRKACLLLGALSDGESDLARLVVQEGGLQAILNAVTWFRFHEAVANWGLWAVFILCYEDAVNKVSLVQMKGVPVVLDAMKHNSSNIEVNRHGTAILFDLLRENSNDDSTVSPNLDVWKIRKIALAAGLHERLLQSIEQFSGGPHMDIVLMAKEMLAGTGYRGDIPGGNIISIAPTVD